MPKFITNEPYPRDFNKVMQLIRKAIILSFDYCNENVPQGIRNPYELWNFLKPRVTFQHDFDGDENIQTAEGLFDRNIHGIPGAGDCDCFVVLVSACAHVRGIPVDIVVSGRSRTRPVHIYNYLYDNNQRIPFDLTEPNYMQERYYPYKQIFEI